MPFASGLPLAEPASTEQLLAGYKAGLPQRAPAAPPRSLSQSLTPQQRAQLLAKQPPAGGAEPDNLAGMPKLSPEIAAYVRNAGASLGPAVPTPRSGYADAALLPAGSGVADLGDANAFVRGLGRTGSLEDGLAQPLIPGAAGQADAAARLRQAESLRNAGLLSPAYRPTSINEQGVQPGSRSMSAAGAPVPRVGIRGEALPTAPTVEAGAPIGVGTTNVAFRDPRTGAVNHTLTINQGNPQPTAVGGEGKVPDSVEALLRSKGLGNLANPYATLFNPDAQRIRAQAQQEFQEMGNSRDKAAMLATENLKAQAAMKSADASLLTANTDKARNNTRSNIEAKLIMDGTPPSQRKEILRQWDEGQAANNTNGASAPARSPAAQVGVVGPKVDQSAIPNARNVGAQVPSAEQNLHRALGEDIASNLRSGNYKGNYEQALNDIHNKLGDEGIKQHWPAILQQLEGIKGGATDELRDNTSGYRVSRLLHFFPSLVTGVVAKYRGLPVAETMFHHLNQPLSEVFGNPNSVANSRARLYRRLLGG